MKLSMKLNHIFPISEHPSYIEGLEYSDKVILPLSVYYAYVRCSLPAPPLFLISSLRYKLRPIVCGALEFSAKEDSIYCPQHMLSEMGCQSYKHWKAGILIQSLPRPKAGFYFPTLRKVELTSPVTYSEEEIKRGLLYYSVISKNSYLSVRNKQIFLGNTETSIRITELEPFHTCQIINNNFTIVFNKQEEIHTKHNYSLRYSNRNSITHIHKKSTHNKLASRRSSHEPNEKRRSYRNSPESFDTKTKESPKNKGYQSPIDLSELSKVRTNKIAYPKELRAKSVKHNIFQHKARKPNDKLIPIKEFLKEEIVNINENNDSDKGVQTSTSYLFDRSVLMFR